MPRIKTKPDWLKIKLQSGPNFQDLKDIVNSNKLHTVCQEALCPNISECWERRAATIMILGDVCTRSCGFCAVKTGRPTHFDPGEPRRTAAAVKQMGLRHCVITSVDRNPVRSLAALETAMASASNTMVLEVRRNGKEVVVVLRR